MTQVRSRQLQFPNRRQQQLSARLDLPPQGEPRACALFAHCFTCSKNLNAVTNISRALTAAGIGVLRFDFTGLGESEGDFADTNFSTNIDDLEAAAEHLAAEVGTPELLIGHSLGGAAVLQAADRIRDSVGVVTIGAPAEPSHVLKLIEGSRDKIESEGAARVELAGRPFLITRQFLEDLEETSMAASIRSLRRALLIFHSPLDNTVGIDNAARIFEAAKHPKSFISLDEADHLLSRRADSRYVGSVIAAWADRYLSHQAGGRDQESPPEKGVRVTIGQDHYRTHIQARSHQLVADEPQSVGGSDQGATPYELLSASLGACTVITLRMYADRKEWPVDRIGVDVEHSRIHARDCAECEEREGRIDLLERTLDFEGDLSDEQKTRLTEIAERCPVHRTLEGRIVIRTR